MGVLNVTPDSFSDGGQLSSTQAVVDRASEMLTSGADLLDLGGESTRPGGQPVSAVEEMDRVLPALAALRRAWPDVPISIDTYKAGVAEAAICGGANMMSGGSLRASAPNCASAGATPRARTKPTPRCHCHRWRSWLAGSTALLS